MEKINDLLIYSLELCNVQNPEQRLNKDKEGRALRTLNSIILQLQSKGIYIPYFKNLEFTLLAGKNEYRVSRETGADVDADKIISIDYANLDYVGRNWPFKILTDAQYYDRWKYTELKTTPHYVLLLNNPNSSDLLFYATPDIDYSFSCRGKFVLPKVELNSLLTDFPDYYVRFFVYAVARELSDIYSGKWTDKHESEYQRVFKDVLRSNDEKSLDIKTSSVLNRRKGDYRYGIDIY